MMHEDMLPRNSWTLKDLLDLYKSINPGTGSGKKLFAYLNEMKKEFSNNIEDFVKSAKIYIKEHPDALKTSP